MSDKDKLSYSLALECTRGDLTEVKNVCNRGIGMDVNYDKAIQIAVDGGHLEIVKYLHEQGANIQVLNNDPIQRASQKGYTDIVIYLCESGADIHARNDNALRLAVSMGHTDIVKYLCEHGADINALTDFITFKENLDIIKCLHENGADVCNYRTVNAASYYGHINILEYLHMNGANINLNNTNHLDSAICNGKIDVVKFLLRHNHNFKFNISSSMYHFRNDMRIEIYNYINRMNKTKKASNI